ncbi:MAG: Zn-ribbon domain-containing OB-fold protein [Spirochaetota bacterium]|nr:Zn-ribbon domain-containing OB-fold protein [Spirochaetota bacterium]
MSFKETIQSNIQLSYFEGQIPVNYQYTLGVAGNKFFETLKQKGEFIASVCSHCGVKTIYPLIYCEECFNPIDTYVSIELEGELYSFTKCYRDYQGNTYDEPHVIGLIRFDGIKGGIIHRLNINEKDLKLGIRVKAKLKPTNKRTGGLDDIVCFEKV